MNNSAKLQNLFRNLLLAGLGLVSGLPATVSAQAVLEEVLVTATRRGETDIQVTPISVTALSSDVLDKMLLHDLGSGLGLNVDGGAIVQF